MSKAFDAALAAVSRPLTDAEKVIFNPEHYELIKSDIGPDRYIMVEGAPDYDERFMVLAEEVRRTKEKLNA